VREHGPCYVQFMSQADSLNDFGLLIAIVIPGFTLIYGFTYLQSEWATWIQPETLNATSLSSFLLLSIASVAAGLTIHTIRWITLDALHHRTGIKPRRWDFSKFEENLGAYDKLTENHYRFYQFYGGMLISLIWVFVARKVGLSWRLDWYDLGICFVWVLFFFASRDTLTRYYERLNHVLK
jgi:hypothetical protein